MHEKTKQAIGAFRMTGINVISGRKKEYSNRIAYTLFCIGDYQEIRHRINMEFQNYQGIFGKILIEKGKFRHGANIILRC